MEEAEEDQKIIRRNQKQKKIRKSENDLKKSEEDQNKSEEIRGRRRSQEVVEEQRKLKYQSHHQSSRS